jgi:glycosyl hydrolase group 75 (putative chitosanase)
MDGTRAWILGLAAVVILGGAVITHPLAAFAGPDAKGRDSATAAESGPEVAQNGALNTCSRTLLADFDPDKGEYFGHDVSVWTVGDDNSAVLFQSGMTIDADGAPNAYNPANTGLDDIANAGEPGHWDGIVADRGGAPYIQGPDDPYPGFYVSQTALVDWSKPFTDPTRYVDASKIPYIVLPGELSQRFGARLGDFAVVANQRRQKSAFAIFADIGTLGEGSIALADQLGIWSDAREGGTRGGITYLIFPGSGNHHPHSADEIDATAGKLFENWGGMDKLTSCATEMAAAHAQVAARNFH